MIDSHPTQPLSTRICSVASARRIVVSSFLSRARRVQSLALTHTTALRQQPSHRAPLAARTGMLPMTTRLDAQWFDGLAHHGDHGGDASHLQLQGLRVRKSRCGARPPCPQAQTKDSSLRDGTLAGIIVGAVVGALTLVLSQLVCC